MRGAVSLGHLKILVSATSTLAKGAAIANIFSAFLIGLFLRIVYSRSRNLLSVAALHWWFNLQRELTEYLAFRFLW